ncbi:carbohydrate ABC transporter permease [Nonomuraea sp. NPDC003727]
MMERPNRAAQGAKAVTLTAIFVIAVFPFLLVLGTSLASREEIVANGGYVLIPRHPSLAAYAEILSGGVVGRAVLVSIGITIVGTLLSLATTVAMAYGLSRPSVVGSKAILMVGLLTFLISPGIIPSYLLVKQLGLLDSYWSLILPNLLGAFNLVILRAFFMKIPRELLDAARIDGAGDLKTLRVVVLPLSKAVIAVVGLFQAVGFWNSFFDALLYLNDASKWPLQLVLNTYVLNSKKLPGQLVSSAHMPPSQALQMAIVVIALVPVLAAYPFLQKHFTKGVLTGAVKG